MLAVAPPASAHGDPPLAYLQGQSLYPAFADPPAPALELRLLGLLRAAEERGYPIKVALLANAGDLDDHQAVLRRPEAYAAQLVRELGGPSQLSAPLLVVTPHGLGVAGPDAGTARAALGRPDAPGPSGDALALAALPAVREISRAGGHPLPAHVPPASAIVSPPDEGLSIWQLLGLVAAALGAAWLVLELRDRRRRRAGRAQTT